MRLREDRIQRSVATRLFVRFDTNVFSDPPDKVPADSTHPGEPRANEAGIGNEDSLHVWLNALCQCLKKRTLRGCVAISR